MIYLSKADNKNYGLYEVKEVTTVDGEGRDEAEA